VECVEFSYLSFVDNGFDEVLSGINSELAGLHTQAKFLNEVIDRLHAENERLRNAESNRAVQPALRELIKLADDWRSRESALRERDGDSEDLLRLCGEIVEDVTLVLERQGVDEFHPEPGAEFDRREQRAVGTRPTDDSELDGRIAESRRPGYRAGAHVVRFAEVVLLKFTPPPAP
jgi:molecular chaperone GrpE (heat shock protein)